WYDAYVSSTLANYNAFEHNGTANLRLVMGPWLHGDRNISHSGDVEFGPQAVFDGQVDRDWLSCRLAWFEQSLKPSPQPAKARVDVFLMGG
ncbi:hypothetical protein KZY98_14875, partial [Croceibacter atlanticus]|nr:hypothetical protein [Croceibacter atlanticus]